MSATAKSGKPAGKPNGKPIEKTNGQISESEFQQDTSPTTPQMMGSIKHKGTKEYKYYLSVKWDRLWDEYAFSIDERGKLTYRSVRQLAKAKAREGWQRDVIITACGARPDPEQTKRLKFPWLGDWQKRRSLGFWSLEDPAKVESIQTAIKERKDSFDAVRALAPNVADQIEYFMKMNRDLVDAFGGQVLLGAHPPTHPVNIKRFKTWLKMQKEIWILQKDAYNEWYKLFGVPQLDAGNWMKMLAATSAASSFGAARGAALASPQVDAGQSILLPEGVTQTHLLVAQTIAGKCQDYGLPIPEIKAKSEKAEKEVKH